VVPGVPGANVGWFPLAPHEIYVPAHPVSETYLRHVNLANTTVADSAASWSVYRNGAPAIHYRNGTAGAITQVSQDAFTSAQRIVGRTVPVIANTLAGMTVAAAAPAIPPVRHSALGAAGHGAPRPPPPLANRTVVARAAPPRPPALFDAQLAAIQTNAGRPLTRAELARLPPGTPTAQVHLLAPSSKQAGVATGARTQQNRALPPATTTRTFVYDPAPPPVPSPGVATPLRADRPAWAPHPAETVARPVSTPPATANPPTPAAAAGAPAPQTRTPRAPASAPPPAPRTQGSHQDSRADSSPKADRSRERVER
jgi:hypothetical protein